MSAMTSEDLTRPAVDVPPSRRIKTPEQLAYELDQIDSSDFQLSDAGRKRRHELQEQLNELSAVEAVDRQKILTALTEGAEAVEQVSTAAIAALEEYIRLRMELIAVRAPYDQAYRAARDANIPCAPRVRIAPTKKMMDDLSMLMVQSWYRDLPPTR